MTICCQGLRQLTINRAICWFDVSEAEQRVRALVIFFGGQHYARHMLTQLLRRRLQVRAGHRCRPRRYGAGQDDRFAYRLRTGTPIYQGGHRFMTAIQLFRRCRGSFGQPGTEQSFVHTGPKNGVPERRKLHI